MTLQQGTVLCGFGKAKFREADKKEQNPDNEIIFEVTGDSMGILDGAAGTMEEFLRKGDKPNLRICYHKTSMQPDGSYSLEKERGY